MNHLQVCVVSTTREFILITPMQTQNQGDQKIVEPNGAGSKIENIEAGNLSNENAEKRANAGPDQPFTSIQAFDGVGEHHEQSHASRYNSL